ncbi:hypothetical protein DFH08DRAFT_720898, partial [Mycena albidolilacea]
MSDVTTSAYRIQHLLGEENYPTWAVKLTDILTDQGLIDYAAAILAWERKDRQALSQIRLRVSDDPLVYITDATTSSSAWRTLADMYQPKGVISIV